MAFFLGSRFPKQKKLLISLKTIKGFSISTCKLLLSSLGCLVLFSTTNLRSSHLQKLQKLVFFLKLSFGTETLRQLVFNARETLRLAKHRRAIRFFQGLPVRGQRTRTNAQTSRKHKVNK